MASSVLFPISYDEKFHYQFQNESRGNSIDDLSFLAPSDELPEIPLLPIPESTGDNLMNTSLLFESILLAPTAPPSPPISPMSPMSPPISSPISPPTSPPISSHSPTSSPLSPLHMMDSPASVSSELSDSTTLTIQSRKRKTKKDTDNKKERNKASAAKYRKKKKQYVDGLEGKVEALGTTIDTQKKTITTLRTENRMLKDQLAYLKTLINTFKSGKIPLTNASLFPAAVAEHSKAAAGVVMFTLLVFFMLFNPASSNAGELGNTQGRRLVWAPTDGDSPVIQNVSGGNTVTSDSAVRDGDSGSGSVDRGDPLGSNILLPSSVLSDHFPDTDKLIEVTLDAKPFASAG